MGERVRAALAGAGDDDELRVLHASLALGVDSRRRIRFAVIVVARTAAADARAWRRMAFVRTGLTIIVLTRRNGRARLSGFTEGFFWPPEQLQVAVVLRDFDDVQRDHTPCLPGVLCGD